MRGVPADGSENDDTVGWCDEKMTESRESGQAVRSLYCCTCCRSWKGRICIFRVFFLLNTRKYILVIQARKTCACIWFFWALNYHDFQGRLKRRGGISAAVCLHHADRPGLAHVLTEQFTSLSFLLAHVRPRSSAKEPVQNTNAPNSICRS